MFHLTPDFYKNNNRKTIKYDFKGSSQQLGNLERPEDLLWGDKLNCIKMSRLISAHPLTLRELDIIRQFVELNVSIPSTQFKFV